MGIPEFRVGSKLGAQVAHDLLDSPERNGDLGEIATILGPHLVKKSCRRGQQFQINPFQ